MVIADHYLKRIKATFQFETKQSFCQIATVSNKHNLSKPKMRTVLLYFDQSKNCFYFTCSTQTHKWCEIKAISTVTGVYFDVSHKTQYRFEAKAVLVDKTVSNESAFYEDTWKNLRSDLRHILWQEYLDDPSLEYDINTIFPYHGNVLLYPYYWDIFKLGIDDFANSHRTQMILKNQTWEVFDKTPRICPLPLI